jgi:hypothetical protein
LLELLKEARFSGIGLKIARLAGTCQWRVQELPDRLPTGKKVQQALRCVIAETHLEDPVRTRGFGRAAGKESLFIREERVDRATYRVRLTVWTAD